MPLAQVVQHIIPYLRTHTNYDLGLIQQNLTRTQNTLSLKRTSGAGFGFALHVILSAHTAFQSAYAEESTE